MTTKATPGQLALGLTTPILSRADQDARPDRQTRLDAARAVLARGLSGVREDPAKLRAYLAFRAHFHNYSARNALLIWMQRPSARFCMGFKAWTKHGRRVRRGERGITVFAPVLRKPTAEEVAAGTDPDDRVPAGYRTATTFDYEQTEPTRDDALVYAPPGPRLGTDGPADLVARLEAVAVRLGCTVRTSHLGYADGWYREADRVICLRASLSGADRASVLCHELAHVVAHTGDWETPRSSKELQAEGASYLALAALGLDTAQASLPYLKGWASGDDESLCAELAAIDRIALQLLELVGDARQPGSSRGGARARDVS